MFLIGVLIGLPLQNHNYNENNENVKVNSAYGFSSSIWYWGDNQPGDWVRSTWRVDPITVGIAGEKGVDKLYFDLVEAGVNNWSYFLKQRSNNTVAWNFIITNYGYLEVQEEDSFYDKDISIYIRKNDCGGSLGTAFISTLNYEYTVSASVDVIANYCDDPITWISFFDTVRQEFGHTLGLGHVSPWAETYTPPLDVMVVDMTTHQQNNVLHHITNLSLDAMIAIYFTDGFAPPNIGSVPVGYICKCEVTVVIQDEPIDIWGNIQGDYHPNIISVPKGTIVIWKNNDLTPEDGDSDAYAYGVHTVTSGLADDDEWGTVFDSGLIKYGKQFKHQFNVKGEYPYLCALHPWMVGKVIVN